MQRRLGARLHITGIPHCSRHRQQSFVDPTTSATAPRPTRHPCSRSTRPTMDQYGEQAAPYFTLPDMPAMSQFSGEHHPTPTTTTPSYMMPQLMASSQVAESSWEESFMVESTTTLPAAATSPRRPTLLQLGVSYPRSTPLADLDASLSIVEQPPSFPPQFGGGLGRAFPLVPLRLVTNSPSPIADDGIVTVNGNVAARLRSPWIGQPDGPDQAARDGVPVESGRRRLRVRRHPQEAHVIDDDDDGEASPCRWQTAPAFVVVRLLHERVPRQNATNPTRSGVRRHRTYHRQRLAEVVERRQAEGIRQIMPRRALCRRLTAPVEKVQRYGR